MSVVNGTCEICAGPLPDGQRTGKCSDACRRKAAWAKEQVARILNAGSIPIPKHTGSQ